MYDADGNVIVTKTKSEFEGAARPDVDPALENHCIEGKFAWLDKRCADRVHGAHPDQARRRGHSRGNPKATLASRSTVS